MTLHAGIDTDLHAMPVDVPRLKVGPGRSGSVHVDDQPDMLTMKGEGGMLR